MARFIDVHEGFVGVSQDQLAAAHALDLANEGVEGVHFEHAWLDPESGKAFCLSTGPSKEASCECTRSRASRRPRCTRSPRPSSLASGFRRIRRCRALERVGTGRTSGPTIPRPVSGLILGQRPNDVCS
jgi:hypothetical protein